MSTKHRDNVDTRKKNTDTLIDASKETGLDINADKTKYMLLSRHQNVGQNLDIEIANRSFENVSQLKYSIIRRRMRWAGHLARMGRRGTLLDYWWESQRERVNYEDPDVGGWIILGWILERWDGVMWTGLVWLRIGTGGELL
jgi:hypothetical protein